MNVNRVLQGLTDGGFQPHWMRLFVEAAREELGGRSAAVYLVDQPSRQVFLSAASGYPNGLDEMALCARYGLGEGLTGYVAELGRALFLPTENDIRSHPAHLGKYHLKELDCTSLIAIPVHKGPRCVGVLKLERGRSDASFDHAALEGMEILSRLVSLALPNSRRAYHRAFMAMPFGNAVLDEIYRQVVVPACASEGVLCVRSDEPAAHGELDRHILEQVKASDFLILDLTGDNSNVTFELGLAIGLGKTVIPLRMKTPRKGVPTDYRNLIRVEYDAEDRQKLFDVLASTVRSVVHSTKPGIGYAAGAN